MESWDESFIRAKYHFSVAERMYGRFPVFEEKKFIVGIINELARSASFLIKAFLIREIERGNIKFSKNIRKNFKIFISDIAPNYLNRGEIESFLKIFEIERAQKETPIQFLKGKEIGFMVGGEYKFLRSKKLGEFLASIGDSIQKFKK